MPNDATPTDAWTARVHTAIGPEYSSLGMIESVHSANNQRVLMMDSEKHSPLPGEANTNETRLVEPSQDALSAKLRHDRRSKYVRFAIAAMGSIPWVGGFIAASASFSAERQQEEINDLQRMWLDEHKEKIKELNDTLADIFTANPVGRGWSSDLPRKPITSSPTPRPSSPTRAATGSSPTTFRRKPASWAAMSTRFT